MSTSSRKPRKRPRGSLSIVALMLIGSATLRFSGDAGQAMALNTEQTETKAGSKTQEQFAVVDDHGIRQLLAAINRREERVKIKEKEIQARLIALREIDAEVNQRIEELEMAEEQLRATLTIAETAANDDVERLTLVYENMKPKQAAALFEEMDPHFAAGFLGRMRADAAAAIMAGLSAEAANLYSVILAGRNANAPRN